MMIAINSMCFKPVIDVWVIDGQSNAVGSVGNVVLPLQYQNPNANAKIVGLMNSDNENQNEISSFQTLTYGVDGVGNTLLGNIHGVAPSLSYNYGDRSLFIVKVAEGATSLAVDWATGSLLRNKLYFYINYAKQYFLDNNIRVRWFRYRNQYDSDVNDSTRANNWGANLDAFDIDLFNNTGITFEKYIHVKPSENPQNSFYSSYPTNTNTLLTYLNQRVANEDNFYLLDVDDLPLRDEGLFLHQDSAGQIEMGNRLYGFI